MNTFFADLNLLTVMVAAAGAFALGGAWYSPPFFGQRWLEALGPQKDRLGSPMQAMAWHFVVVVVTAFAMAWLAHVGGIVGAREGLLMGLGVGIAFVATAMLSDYLFAGWSNELFLIQAGYRIAYLGLMGAILGAGR